MFLALAVGTILFCVVQYVLTRKGKFYSSLVLAILYSLLTLLYLEIFIVFIVIILWILFFKGVKNRKNNSGSTLNKIAVSIIIFTTFTFIGYGYY